LVTARQEKLSSDKRQEVSDLRDDGSIFSNEKALMLLYNPDMDADNGMEPSNEFSVFQNCSISGCTASSKETVIRRIKAIQKIHKIRKIFAQQCFIGIVGIQDAGKTTLLKKVYDYENYGFCCRMDIFLF
jgi:replicative DNA helicase